MGMSDFTVFVIDNEPTTRSSTAAQVTSMGFACQTFSSAELFLQTADLSQPGCVVVDFHLDGMNAFQLQERLVQQDSALPILFMGVTPSVSEVVRAMRGGAFWVFEKPSSANELDTAIRQAAATTWLSRVSHRRIETLRACYETLTSRERDVLAQIVAGVPTKTIARQLGVCHRTAAQIRANIFKKMNADSAVDLAVMTNNLLQSNCAGIVAPDHVSNQFETPQCAC